MNIYYQTLGCKVNSFETAAIEELMKSLGHGTADNIADADCIILNSCAVTAAAENHSIKAIRAARRKNPEIITVLCGCVPQAFPDKYADSDYIDIIVGNASRAELPGIIDDFRAFGKPSRRVVPHTSSELYEDLPLSKVPGHTRAFLKIEDGCNRFCTYCVIPYARGRIRSLPLDQLEKRSKDLAENGYKEIVLCGINLNKYGEGEGYDLADAVIAAAKPDGIKRIRLGSLEPELLTEEVLKKMSNEPKLCPQFHLALQSGCTETLRRMNRRYDIEEYMAAAERVKKYYPDAVFTTDVMVGFPGETEEEFEKSLDFVKNFGFLKCHVFPYSIRPGTKAADMPDQIDKHEKDKRASIMQQTSDAVRNEIIKSFDGRKCTMILEQPQDGWFTGYNEHYVPSKAPLSAGKIGDMIECILKVSPDGECVAEKL